MEVGKIVPVAQSPLDRFRGRGQAGQANRKLSLGTQNPLRGLYEMAAPPAPPPATIHLTIPPPPEITKSPKQNLAISSDAHSVV
jgi:hypothetical protein